LVENRPEAQQGSNAVHNFAKLVEFTERQGRFEPTVCVSVAESFFNTGVAAQFILPNFLWDVSEKYFFV
jgi:hypothetical protein